MESDEADGCCLRATASGDRDAFTELVVRYQRPLYNAAFWILRKPEDASDITQIVFLKVAERLDEYDPKYKFFSWIYRIAVNESLNLLRRQRARTSSRTTSTLRRRKRRPGAAGWARRSCRASMRDALMTMATNDRMVLTLRHFSECSYEEIAQILEHRREDREVAPVRGEAAACAACCKDLDH